MCIFNYSVLQIIFTPPPSQCMNNECEKISKYKPTTVLLSNNAHIYENGYFGSL